MDDTNSHSGTKNPLFNGASGSLYIAGLVSLLLSAWTNPALFSRQLAWLPSHYILLMLGIVIIIAAGHIVRLNRRIADLELKA